MYSCLCMIHSVFPLQAAVLLCCCCSPASRLLSAAAVPLTNSFLTPPRTGKRPPSPPACSLPLRSSRPAGSASRCPAHPSPRHRVHQEGSHRSVGFLLPGMFGCFARLRRALHMHGVYDVKEIFHHSHAFQRDALGLRQSICPLQQCRQVELVSAVGDRGDEMGPGLMWLEGAESQSASPELPGAQGRWGIN